MISKNCIVLFQLVFLSPLVLFAEAGWVKVEADPTIVKFQDSYGHCTGTRISAEGHILTARHCFNQCLISGQFVNQQALFPEYGWQSPQLYTFPNDKKAVCRTTVDGVVKDIEILFTSSGFMTPSAQGSLSVSDPDIYNEFLDNHYLYNGDYAIVKEEVTQRTSCRELSVEPSLANDRVHYKGYPSASTGRPAGRDSDGQSLSLSQGYRTSSVSNNSCVPSEQLTAQVLGRYDRSELYLSTVDVVPGASGSALLNTEGRIVGVINSVYSPRQNIYSHYCSGAAVAVSVARILQHLEEQQISASRFFACSGVESFNNSFLSAGL